MLKIWDGGSRERASVRKYRIALGAGINSLKQLRQL